MRLLIQIGVISLLLFSCKKKEVQIEEYVDTWGFEQPSHFPEPDYKFENNTLSKQKFELGRFLFYDPILSLDSTVSCATCHAQEHAFADHNVPFSMGVDGALGVRNSPALSNLAWYPNFMWDGGINHIETFSVGPITNMLEMKETVSNVMVKLNNSPFYLEKFKEAFGVDNITDDLMLKSLAQFMAMLVSSNSKYDNYIKGEVEFTSSELNGYQLFQQNCVSCHTEPLTTDFSYRNNGLDSIFSDQGRALITLLEEDKGKFKVPSLRNVAQTYPYMHDGRFFTLDAVLDFYSTGIIDKNTTDELVRGGFNFSSSQKSDLKAFLKTLTDYYLIGDPAFSPPSR